MNRFFPAFIALIALSHGTLRADAPLPSGHSEIHIVFMKPHSPQMFGGGRGNNEPMAHVGDFIFPADDIQPIRISINGDFVGHALIGMQMQNIKPIFVLPGGSFKFKFEIDGFAPVESSITVLGTGSKQYLIVKLPSKKGAEQATGDSIDNSIKQPFDN